MLCSSSVSSLYVCFLFGLGGISNVLSGGGVRSPGEVGVLVGPPFGWTHPFGDGVGLSVGRHCTSRKGAWPSTSNIKTYLTREVL